MKLKLVLITALCASSSAYANSDKVARATTDVLRDGNASLLTEDMQSRVKDGFEKTKNVFEVFKKFVTRQTQPVQEAVEKVAQTTIQEAATVVEASQSTVVNTVEAAHNAIATAVEASHSAVQSPAKLASSLPSTSLCVEKSATTIRDTLVEACRKAKNNFTDSAKVSKTFVKEHKKALLIATATIATAVFIVAKYKKYSARKASQDAARKEN